MEKKDNIGKKSFGQSLLKRFSVFALILIIGCGILLCLCVNKNDSPVLAVSAATSSTTVTLEADDDFVIQGGDKCIGLSETGKAKIGDNNFIVKIPNRVTQVGSTENSTAMFDADLKGKVVGLDFSIATNLTTIGKGVFSGLTSLESVTIPKTVTTIYEDAFRNCSALKKVVIAQGSVLNSIGDHAFSGTKLCAIELPDSVNVLGSLDTECNAFGSAYVVSSNLRKLEYFKKHGVYEYSCALKVELRFKKSEIETKTEYKLAFYGVAQPHWLCYNDGEWYVDQSYELPDTDKGCWYGSFHGTSETKYDIDTLTASVLYLNSDIYKSDVKPFEFTFKPFLKTADPNLQLENNQLMFNRQSQVPQISTTLSADTDFDIEYYKKQSSGSSYNKVDATQVAEVNQYYVLLKGKGKYCGETRLDFSIEKASLTDATIYFTSDDATWQGPNKEVKLQVSNVVTSNGVTLYASEYNVSYRTTRDYTTYGSEVTVRVVANSDSSFKDYATKTYTITKRNIENVVISGYEERVTYTGERIEFNELIVKDQGINYELVSDIDYRIVYPYHDTDAGTVTIELEGLKNYCGSTTFSYEVEAADVQGQLAIGFRGQDNPEYNDFTYDAKPHGKAYVYWKINAQELLGNYYTTTYTKNGVTLDIKNYDDYTGGFWDAGTLQVKVELKGNYKGTLTAEYVIRPREMREGEFKNRENKPDMDTTYTGYPIRYYENKYLSFYDLATQSTFGLGSDDYTRVITRLSGVDDSNTWVNAGIIEVKYIGQKNFTGEKSYTYEIYPYDISNTVVVRIRQQGNDNGSWKKDNELKIKYTGSPILVEADLYAKEYCVLGEHYTLTYSGDHTNVGTVTVTITGINNYKGQCLIRFEILPLEIMYWRLKESQVTYTGESFEGNIVQYVQDSYSYSLVEGRDYTLVYTRDDKPCTDFTNVGTIVVEVIGTENCIIKNGPLKKEFKINPYQISNEMAEIELEEIDLTWRDEDIKPKVLSITITDGDKDPFVLSKIYYEVIYPEYRTNSEGEVTITINAIGNYKGTLNTSYVIAKRNVNIANLIVQGIDGTVYYTGSKIQFPNIEFKEDFGGGHIYTLKLGTDYSSIVYSNNTDVGQATIELNCIHNYEGTKVFHFNIERRPIEKLYVSQSTTYSGNINRSFWSADAKGQTVYESETDKCTVVYKRNGVETEDFIHAGIITIEVTGIGNYCGYATGEFEIKRASLDGASLSLLQSDSTIYNSHEIYRNIIIEMRLNGREKRLQITDKVLTTDDFNVIYERINGGDTTDIKSVGTIQIKVVGKEEGNYVGELFTTYEITPRQLNTNDKKFSFTCEDGNGHFTYTGEQVKINNYTFKYDDYTLVRGVDYEESYSNNVDVTSYAWLHLNGTGNFTGTYTYQFNIEYADLTDLEIYVDEDVWPFFVGYDVKFHNAEVRDNKYEGYITFDENLRLTEADMDRSDPIVLNWKFEPKNKNYNTAYGTYTIQKGVFIRVLMDFDYLKLQSLTVGSELDFVTLSQTNGDRSMTTFTGDYELIFTNSRGEVVNSLDEVGQYFVEVKITETDKYFVDCDSKKEFYVNARENPGDDNSDIRVTFENGSGDGVEFVHERINDEYIMRDILGYNYSEKVHHIEHISFKRDEQLVFIQNAKIFLENNNNYEVYLYRPEVMMNMSMRNSGASSFALVYNNDSMINITDLIRNNQPIDFSGSEAYLVFQIAEHGSNSQSGANKSSSNLIIFIAIGAVALVAIIATSIVIVKIRKKKKLKSMM